MAGRAARPRIPGRRVIDRPSRLVPTAIAAVKASKQIPAGVKLVFIEDWILDRGPEGAWASAAVLAARLGMSKDNVEKHRRRLLELGFYVVVRREGAKSDGWVPTLPLGCRHHGTSVEDVANTAARIDAYLSGQVHHIRGVPGGAESGVTRSGSRGVPQSATSGVLHAATIRRPLAGGGGKEGGTLIQPAQAETLVPARDSEQESARALELEQEGPPREPTRAEREQMAKADAEEAERVRREGWQKIRDALRVRKSGGAA